MPECECCICGKKFQDYESLHVHFLDVISRNTKGKHADYFYGRYFGPNPPKRSRANKYESESDSSDSGELQNKQEEITIFVFKYNKS